MLQVNISVAYRDDTIRHLIMSWVRDPKDESIQLVLADRLQELGFNSRMCVQLSQWVCANYAINALGDKYDKLRSDIRVSGDANQPGSSIEIYSGLPFRICFADSEAKVTRLPLYVWENSRRADIWWKTDGNAEGELNKLGPARFHKVPPQLVARLLIAPLPEWAA